MMYQGGNLELKSEFEQMVAERGTHEQKWEDYSGWTLPWLYDDENTPDGQEYQHDFHSYG